ncbi:MAG: polyprenyl synthetase family protein [Candidatus Wallbacteria bacterium]|nr:polyprenyl synthetase family protein [Candidatus Wallbacteria bacterium]
MKKNNLELYFRETVNTVDKWLDELLPSQKTAPVEIHRAMRYSVFSGGKRIRPLLLILTAEMLGAGADKVRLPACALELIHTYSLIHDDLPSMDNDDFRRGKPSCHKVFGEALAILAGDALLTEAFVLLSGFPVKHLRPVLREIAVSASTRGMVGGQVLDIRSADRRISRKALLEMHLLKTGALLTAPLSIAGIISGADPGQLDLLALLGEKIGLLFQVTDDILDAATDAGKKPGSCHDKANFVSMYGLGRSRKMAGAVRDEALEILSEIRADDRFRKGIFQELIRFICERRK